MHTYNTIHTVHGQHTYIHIRSHIQYIHTCYSVFIYIHTCYLVTYINTSIHTVHMYIHTWCIHTLIHSYKHTCIHTSIHTYSAMNNSEPGVIYETKLIVRSAAAGFVFTHFMSQLSTRSVNADTVWDVHMHVYKNVCMYIRMYVCIMTDMYIFSSLNTNKTLSLCSVCTVCMYVCTVCMYVCMYYVCMYELYVCTVCMNVCCMYLFSTISLSVYV